MVVWYLRNLAQTNISQSMQTSREDCTITVTSYGQTFLPLLVLPNNIVAHFAALCRIPICRNQFFLAAPLYCKMRTSSKHCQCPLTRPPFSSESRGYLWKTKSVRLSNARQAIAELRQLRGFFGLFRRTQDECKPNYNHVKDGSACRIYGSLAVKRITGISLTSRTSDPHHCLWLANLHKLRSYEHVTRYSQIFFRQAFP
ncbi:hypothetical protein EI94DRAFT_598699 [Lactarius quietus]|nr:hypothetical protein EI94DRAFT_598699 [Lactarius quietus]